MPSEIRREFDKVFTHEVVNGSITPGITTHRDTALWAAKWMAERCADLANNLVNVCDECSSAEALEDSIRQLSKELDQCSAS